MKRKLFFAISALFLSLNVVHAERKPSSDGRKMPDPGSFVSEAVYISSCTCAEGSNLLVSTSAALLAYVNITSTGSATTGLGTMSVFDSKTAASGRKLIERLESNSPQTFTFNVGASSGIAISKTGPFCVTFSYLER